MIYNIISPILGGIIGYFTNWLAIKMLFVPYEAKYIGKIRIPFTPGLIPKERRRISKKIATVVEDKILNNETIKENIFTENNKEKIYLLIEKNFNNLKQKKLTLEDIVKKVNANNNYQVILKIEEKFLNTMEKIIFNKKYQDILSNILTLKIYDFIKNIENNDKLKGSIEKLIMDIIINKDLKNKILNKKLDEIINESNISYIKVYLIENIPKICDTLAYKIENDIEFDNRFGTFIKNIINENVGTFTSLFLSIDKIYDSIKKNIIEYIKEKDNQNILIVKVFEFITKYQNKQIKEIYNQIPDSLKNIVNEKMSEKNIRKFIRENLFSQRFNEKYIYSFKKKINIYIKTFISGEASHMLFKFIENITKSNRDKIWNFNINFILDKIKLEKFRKNVFDIIEKFIQKEGDNILLNISILDMVENKINSFEMEVIEDIIISVAKKELNSITFVGGILGFIIGFVPVLVK